MKILDIGANDGFWYKTNKDRFILSTFTLIEANPLNEPALKQLGFIKYSLVDKISNVHEDYVFEK